MFKELIEHWNTVCRFFNIFGQYSLMFLVVLLCPLVELAFWLLAAAASAAFYLAKTRLKIKEESPPFFEMKAVRILQFLTTIKDPVQASHETYSKTQVAEDEKHSSASVDEEEGSYTLDSESSGDGEAALDANHIPSERSLEA